MIKKLCTMFIVVFFFVCFSPYVTEAVENDSATSEEVTDKETSTRVSEEEATEEEAIVEENESVEEENTKINIEDYEEKSIEPEQIPKTEENVSEENTGEEVVETKEENNLQIQTMSSSVLNPGERSERVLEMKLNLVTLGFGTHWNNPTNYFGPDTVKVVEEFQKYYGLPVTGSGDDATLQKIEEILNSPYQFGNRSEAIRQIKLDLVALGYGTHWKNPTTYYGRDTENVVKEFQRSNRLVVNGIVDSVTLEKIEELLSAPLSYGMRRADVVDFKHDLMAAGFGTHWRNPTNYFGPDTVRVVEEFQRYYGLPVTGSGDNATLKKIEEVLNSPYQFGNRSEAIRQIKLNLVYLGYGIHWKNPTTYYGRDTENVVKEFQRSNGLVVNGIVDSVTLEKIEELLSAPLSYGMRRADVVDFKHDLMAAGFGTHWRNPTNYFGPDTVRVVEEFQRYYGLPVTGSGDDATLKKIEEVLNSPYQFDKRSEEIGQIKQSIFELGFGTHWRNPTNYYGRDTENIVKELQKHYGLVVNGIIDEVTLAKIDEESSKLIKQGQRSDKIKEIKNNLHRLGFGTHWTNPSNYFGEDTKNVVLEFQKFYGLAQSGTMNEFTLKKIDEILSSPLQFGARSQKVKDVKKDLMKIGFGTHWKNPTTYFGRDTEKVVREFQNAYNLPVSGIVDQVTLEEIQDILKRQIRYRPYGITLQKALEIQMKANPQTDQKYAYVSKRYVNSKNEVTASNGLNVRTGPGTSYDKIGSLPRGTKVKVLEDLGSWYRIEYDSSAWVNASKDDVLYFLNPTNFINHDQYRFQFLDLSRTSGASVSLLNSYLKGKGTLEGMGAAFIEASMTYGVNEVYLLSHAILETGHGTSELAQGVRVGMNRSGKPVLVTKSNEKNLKNIKTVYNMFGIGADDEAPVKLGAIRAYEEGWTSPKKAIIGGAKFIGNNYIQAGQNTLYKMRWNPDAMARSGVATHQYATDIRWAVKQTGRIYSLYKEIGISTIYLEIPQYK